MAQLPLSVDFDVAVSRPLSLTLLSLLEGGVAAAFHLDEVRNDCYFSLRRVRALVLKVTVLIPSSVDVGIDSYHLPHNRGRWCCPRCPEASLLLRPSVDVATVFLLSVDFSLRSRHVDDGAVVLFPPSADVGAAATRP